MTPQEIHIAINLGLQKVGSFAYSNIKPELIDTVFNRMGDAYITEHTTRRNNPQQAGLEDNISRLSTIQELITEKQLVLSSLSFAGMQYVRLPYNYFSFVEAKAEAVFSCNNSPLEYEEVDYDRFRTTLSFRQSDFGSPDSTPFSDVKIYKVINTIPVKIFDFSDFSTGLNDIEEIFTVKNKILEEINRTQDNLNVYWEAYNPYFQGSSLIFVSHDSAFLNQGMKIEYTSVLNSSSSFVSDSGSRFDSASGDYDEKDSYCRLVSNEEAYHLLNHPFGTTSPESPIITINNNDITAYSNERFILKTITLKYIRKPRRMNLPLNQSYDIQDERALAKIIDMSVEYLAATIESTGYQALTLENQQRD